MKKQKSILLIIISIFFFNYNYVQSEKDDILKTVPYKTIEVNTLSDISNVSQNIKNDELFVFSIKKLTLRNLNVKKRKEVFIQLLLPTIRVVHEEIKNEHNIIDQLKIKPSLSEKEKNYSTILFKKYKVKFGNWEELKSKMIIYPTSLILSQGAIESAWGTSRFFREANNIFGVWSTNPNEPRLAARFARSNGFVPHLKKYKTLKESVSDLIFILSTKNVYKKVRELSQKGKSPSEITAGLTKYSEEGQKYIRKVKTTLRVNNFIKYDLN